MAWEQLAITAGSALAGTIFDSLGNDDKNQLQNEVVNSILDQRATYERQARGEFTDAEQQDIMQASEPQVNRAAGNIAARGFSGDSPIGAQLTAEAQARPFEQAQTIAAQQLPVYNQAAYDITKELAMQDDSFFDDVRQLSENLTFLSEEGIFDDILEGLFGKSDEISQLLEEGLFDSVDEPFIDIVDINRDRDANTTETIWRNRNPDRQRRVGKSTENIEAVENIASTAIPLP